MGPNGRALLRTITIAQDRGNTVEIGAGLKPSDRVIDNPPDSLQTGDAVQLAHGGGRG